MKKMPTAKIGGRKLEFPPEQTEIEAAIEAAHQMAKDAARWRKLIELWCNEDGLYFDSMGVEELTKTIDERL